MTEKRYALLIIDMQNDFVLPEGPWRIKDAAKTVPVIRKLLDAFRKRKLPVFHIIRQYREDGSDVELPRKEGFLGGRKVALAGTRGAEIVDELKPSPGEYVIVKHRYSGFFMTELPLLLRRLSVDTVVVAGTQDHNCVRATIYDAISYDYNVILLEDATSSQTQEIHEQNIRDMKNIGVNVITSNEFMRNLRNSR